MNLGGGEGAAHEDVGGEGEHGDQHRRRGPKVDAQRVQILAALERR